LKVSQRYLLGLSFDPDNGGDMFFSLLHVAQRGSGVHPASSPMGTGDKAAGA
jgi:hypothetical protein